MKTIGFIGLGLIGGSIARTIRKFHPDYRLLAFDKDRSALAEAVSLNVINGICDNDDEQLYNCDYLFLCAPVEFNVEYMEKIKDSLGKNCILTDVGSVKSVIHEKVTELGLEGRFIGGHPMAGSERSGFSNSSDHLLENAYFHARSEQPVQCYLTGDDTQIQVHIRDHGNGIASDRLKSIFDAAPSAPSSAADTKRGMGIGLSICKAIITAHNGEIHAMNHADGAEFFFNLPKEAISHESEHSDSGHRR